MACVTNAANQGSSSNSNRQVAVSGSGILGTLGSMIPSVVTSMAPFVLLFGLGALLVPTLGLGLLLREGKRRYISDPSSIPGSPLTWSFSPSPNDQTYYYRSFPSLKMINTSAVVDGLSDVVERVMRALDNVDKKYK